MLVENHESTTCEEDGILLAVNALMKEQADDDNCYDYAIGESKDGNAFIIVYLKRNNAHGYITESLGHPVTYICLDLLEKGAE